MGKKLVVKGADFSEVAIETRTKQYLYGVPNSQMNGNPWNLNSLGFSLIEQSVLQGKTIYGMRMNVDKAGTITISKSSIVNPTTSSSLVVVAHAVANSTGIVDMAFDVPIELGSGEYLIISAATAKGKFHADGSITGLAQQKFYYKAGTSNIAQNDDYSLDIDFYTFV